MHILFSKKTALFCIILTTLSLSSCKKRKDDSELKYAFFNTERELYKKISLLPHLQDSKGVLTINIWNQSHPKGQLPSAFKQKLKQTFRKGIKKWISPLSSIESWTVKREQVDVIFRTTKPKNCSVRPSDKNGAQWLCPRDINKTNSRDKMALLESVEPPPEEEPEEKDVDSDDSPNECDMPNGCTEIEESVLSEKESDLLILFDNNVTRSYARPSQRLIVLEGSYIEGKTDFALQRLVMHELGHLFGLADTYSEADFQTPIGQPYSIMQGFYSRKEGATFIDLLQDDKDGIRFLWRFLQGEEICGKGYKSGAWRTNHNRNKFCVKKLGKLKKLKKGVPYKVVNSTEYTITILNYKHKGGKITITTDGPWEGSFSVARGIYNHIHIASMGPLYKKHKKTSYGTIFSTRKMELDLPKDTYGFTIKNGAFLPMDKNNRWFNILIE